MIQVNFYLLKKVRGVFIRASCIRFFEKVEYAVGRFLVLSPVLLERVCFVEVWYKG